MLFAEQREKYTNQYAAEFKADLEQETIPACFAQCVTDVSSGMDSNEKNCVRDCYFKKITSKDDMHVLFTQKLALEKQK